MRSILFAVLSLFVAAAIAQPPVPGPDCGTGATVVGSEKAGKVTLGTDPNPQTCTLTHAAKPVVSCAASLESGIDSGGTIVVPAPFGTITTATTLTIYVGRTFNGYDVQDGFVVSYLCVAP